MASSKTALRWIKRPLFLLLCLMVPLIYLRNTFFVKDYKLPVESGSKVSFEGKVRSKTYDEEGKLSTAIVGNALIRFSGYEGPEPVIGSMVRVTGKIREFERPYNKGGFDAVSYYRARGADFSISASRIEETKTAAFLLRERLNSLRLAAAMAVRKYCPLESGTINTLLLAEKSGLSKERKDLYKSVSLSHFLVVSGLHVSAFAGAVYKMLKAVLRRRTPACAITVVVLILYGMLINFGVSVVRAIIMYSMRLIASVLGESYDLISAAALAAILTLAVNPLYLTDSAFIYSFVAVFGIGFMYEAHVMKGLKGLKNKLMDAVKFSLGMGLIMLPVTLYFSGAYTIGALLMNLCIIPFAPLMLGDGFLALISSLCGFSGVAGFFDLIESILLKATDMLALLVARLGFLRLSGRPAIPLIFVYYAALLLVIFKGKKLFSNYSRVLIIAGSVQALAAVWWWSPTISMLYVGQGECIVLRTGPRTVAVSDCGSTSKEQVFDYDLLPFLNVSGVNRIQAFFLSHSDKDHSSGIQECIEKGARSGIPVDMVIVQDLTVEDPKLTELVKDANAVNIRAAAIAAGDRVRLGCWDFKCLWPIRDDEASDVNSASLVLLAKTGDFSILLTGDISTETEAKLLTEKVKADLLKVPHHGSKSASSLDFLRAVSPKAAIISAGINNVYHHPSAVVIDRLDHLGIPWFCTADCGEIDIKVHRYIFSISQYRDH